MDQDDRQAPAQELETKEDGPRAQTFSPATPALPWATPTIRFSVTGIKLGSLQTPADRQDSPIAPVPVPMPMPTQASAAVPASQAEQPGADLHPTAAPAETLVHPTPADGDVSAGSILQSRESSTQESDRAEELPEQVPEQAPAEPAGGEDDFDPAFPNAHTLASAYRILCSTDAFGDLMPPYGTMRRWAATKRLAAAAVSAETKRTLYDLQKLAEVVQQLLPPDRRLLEAEIARRADAQAKAVRAMGRPAATIHPKPPITALAPLAPVATAAPSPLRTPTELSSPAPAAAPEISAPDALAVLTPPPAEAATTALNSTPLPLPDYLSPGELPQLLADIQELIASGLERMSRMEAALANTLAAFNAQAQIVNRQTETVLKALESLEGTRRTLMLKYDAEHTMLREQLAQQRGMSRDGASISVDLTRATVAMNRLTERLEQLDEELPHRDRPNS